jgi:hypothetical protein
VAADAFVRPAEHHWQFCIAPHLAPHRSLKDHPNPHCPRHLSTLQIEKYPLFYMIYPSFIPCFEA